MSSERDLLTLADDLTAWLARPEGILVPADQRPELLNRARQLAEKIRRVDDRIVIGIVGGTGVGKSTLINALAGKEISASTELRPTTNHLVLYRHRDNDFSLKGEQEVHLHDSPGLRKTTLVDFPDFDSLEPGHREVLARHFPELDLLLWIVEPVKYADLAFFNWLALAPQALVNSLFVFNKTDEYQNRYGQKARAVTAEVVADFKEKLKKHAGVDNPEVLPLSALSAFKNPGLTDNPGFAALMDRLGALQDEKFRRHIKSLNLAAMTRALLDDLLQAAQVDAAGRGVQKIARWLEQGPALMADLVDDEALRQASFLKKPWRTALAGSARERAPWPLNFFLFVWDGLTGLFSRRRQPADKDLSLPQPDLSILVVRMNNSRSELISALGSKESWLVQAVLAGWEQHPEPEETARLAAEKLTGEGLNKQALVFAQKQRWRIRHHIPPVLVLAYPFLFMALAWLLPAGLAGNAKSHQISYEISLGNILVLLEIVLGLYLVETIYFTFSLDRAAGRALDRLILQWAGQLKEIVGDDLFAPMAEMARQIEKEIEQLERLKARRPGLI